ncbi:hypothetical protein PAP_01330 [Palaeococcus pacificus DY20341]|uniref:Glycosyltransferase RgtA/B/C/D-like domain-containing protein n=1 Tax=Palaeococcus pacificus DY20341 TaxID=1343739 RepID=A0A075LW71_9EURY|nr:glycosyltransferase family 39 protein [Palaeococcus pacificus]AIF68708.1 hypothetical protein PAP_01330 [Palaeococcus pacificus DY20341]
MKRDLSKYVIALDIFAFALALSILSAPPADSLTYDEALYICIARSLAKNIGSFTYQGVYMMYRPPIYPYTLSLFYRFFGYDSHLAIARLISAMFYALTAVLVYFFALKLFDDKKKGVIASLFYIFNPLSFAMASRALVHSEFTFFYTLALFLLYTGRKESKASYIYLAFISAGIAVLTRYTGLSIIGVFLAYLYLADHWKWLRKKEYYIGFVLFGLTLLPWLYMGHLHYGGAFRTFSVASRVVTLDTPSSAFEYLKLVIKALSLTFVALIFLGFAKQNKDDRGWLLLSWSFIGLIGILTVVHKEVRFLTFLSPVMALLAAEGVYLLYETLLKVRPKSSNKLKAALLLLILLAFLAPKLPNAIEYKREEWDRVGYQEIAVLKYVKDNYNVEKIMVSPRMYTIAGYFFPEAEVDQLIAYPKMKRGILNGYYDVIIYKKGDLLWEEIKESGKYTLIKEFYEGRYNVFVRVD